MKQRKKLNQKTVMIGILVLIVILTAVFSFLNRPRDYYHGISVQFEADTSVEHERFILDQFHDDAVILDADDPSLHDYTLVFPNMSERKVKKLISLLTDTESVHDAYYVRMVNLAGPLDSLEPGA